MKLEVYKSVWGMTGSYEDRVALIAEAGYDGVEGPPPGGQEGVRFRAALERHGMKYIADIVTEGDHETSFRERLAQAAEFAPAMVNCHSAKDGMDYADLCRYFEIALAAAAELGVVCAHETHRGRALYAPWAASDLLQTFPELQLTADFSHWVVVTESLLEEHEPALRLATERAIHIHGRVGHAEGPQVSDPRAPEYAAELAAHEGWWDTIARSLAARGVETLTFTPEYGPPGYLQTLPYTRQPVADLWEVCLWAAASYRKRFASLGL